MTQGQDRFPATDRKVLRRLDEAATRQVTLGILATVVSWVAIVAIGRLHETHADRMLATGLAVVVVALLQLVLIVRFEQIYPRGPARWRHMFSVLLLARSAVWSAFVLALPDTGNLYFLALFLPLVLGAALAATWLADLWTVRGYLLLGLVPPMVDLLWHASPDSIVLAAFLAVFLFSLSRMATHHYRLFWRVLARRSNLPEVSPEQQRDPVPARLLKRVASELRPSLSVVSDALALMHADEIALQQQARRGAATLVDRVEQLRESANLLLERRVPEPVVSSLRRRLEEFGDEIALVAADADVACTTRYAADLPARLRTDYTLHARALRSAAGWVLEQLPPGSRLRLTFRRAAGNGVDYLRSAIDVSLLHLPEGLGVSLVRGQQSLLLDEGVPLPLAVSGEIARLLGGRLVLEDAGRLCLDIALEADGAGNDEPGGESPWQNARVALLGLAADDTEALAGELARAGLKPEPLSVAALAEPWPALLCASPEALAELPASLPTRTPVLVAAGGTEPPSFAGRGNLYWLRLPFGARRLQEVLERVATVRESPAAAAAASAVDKAGAPLRVLLAEDNPVNSQVVQAMLERVGCAVTLAQDGAQAVAAWTRGGIELVLMDVQMPVQDGLAATRAIREQEMARGLRRTPVVAMSGLVGEADVAACLAAGMDDTLGKPVSMAALATLVERYRLRRDRNREDGK
jgi:CheY-like chemotaxis protein